MVANIQYIEKVIATYQEAAEANRRTPFREGNVVVITPDDAEDVMITADLHGNRVNFNAIRKVADLPNQARRHLILQEVCHGGPTYSVNGGCMSHTLVEDIARLIVQFPDRVHFLLGNHELSEVMDYPIVKGQKMLNLQFRYGMQEAYGAATEKVREACIEFFKTCPLAVRLAGDIFVCHTLPEHVDSTDFDTAVLSRPLEEADFQEHSSLFRLLWGRDYSPENAKTFARLVGASVLIHGHDPCPEGFKVPNETQIVLDCSGRPACYVILPTDEQPSQAEVIERIQCLP